MDELRRAVYYPHTTLADPELLKRALLFYDDVEVIVPSSRFDLTPYLPRDLYSEEEQRAMARATEFLVRPHVPTEQEKQRAHQLVLELVKHEVPEWFAFHPDDPRRYEIYPEKFLYETFAALRDKNAAWLNIGPDPVMHPSLGLSLMGVLAKVCAGTTREKITHRADAHRAYLHYVATIGEGTPVSRDEPGDGLRIETIILPGIDLAHADMDKLVELRETEDSFVKTLRRNFQAALAAFRARVREARPQEQEEIMQQFRDDLKTDLNHLEQVLQLERSGSLIKSTTGLLNLKIGDAVEGLAGGLAVVEGLPSFRLRKQEVLEEHSSAWLYVAKQRSR